MEKFACGAAAGMFIIIIIIFCHWNRSMLGALAMTLVYPMYVFQARMAVADPGVYSGIFDCITKSVRVEGYSSLFKGILSFCKKTISLKPRVHTKFDPNHSLQRIRYVDFPTVEGDFCSQGQGH
jgi:hypothetical protein